MKKPFALAIAVCAMIAASEMFAFTPTIIYNGDTLLLNNEFVRRQCGAVKTSTVLPEISGIACSRVTPGYIWMESDDYRQVVATDEKGNTAYMKISFSNLPSRWDWEDMCGGVFEDKNYLFVGAFGDNNETTGNYHIIYFEEPAITTGTNTENKKIEASYIKYEYPDGLHNAEAIMYDNIEQTIYVITKVYYNVCSVYSLPMSLDYGTEVQTLSKVCDLGVKSDLGSDGKRGFHLVTGADISPDGSKILIKNHNNNLPSLSATLIWHRDGEESISETLKRQPEQIECYKEEWQGEAICWLDTTTFYTTSDEDEGEPPIYKYIKKTATSVENTCTASELDSQLVMINGQLFIRQKNRYYSLQGQCISTTRGLR
ncbi:MAG: hypothetical protein IJ776_06765 [Paludibacteraceae bacterium]|nr:hypothetical protein [Paludibacteraceae bacterium]